MRSSGLVAAGRKVGVSGLSAHDDWPAWDADEMQAAVKCLEEDSVLPKWNYTIEPIEPM